MDGVSGRFGTSRLRDSNESDADGVRDKYCGSARLHNEGTKTFRSLRRGILLSSILM